MENIKVVDRTNKEVKVEINKEDGVIQIIIDMPKNNESVLKDLNPGDTFVKNNVEYIVCEHFENGGTAVIRKKCLEYDMEFGDTNNWAESNIRKFLNGEYLKNISEDFSQDNILDHEVCLLSLDGYDDYGRTTDKVSVLTIDRYRKHHKLIGNVDQWNWLATPDSTPSGASSSGVRCVRSDGRVSWDYVGCTRGVRPFFILKSSTFVSPYLRRLESKQKIGVKSSMEEN